MKITESVTVTLTDTDIRAILIAHVEEKLGERMADGWSVHLNYSDGRGLDDHPSVSATLTKTVPKTP